MSRKDKLQAMCATPLEITAGDKVYELTPLGLDAYAELEQWAAQQPFRELESKLSAISDKKLRAKVEEKLFERAIEQSEDPAYISKTLNGSAAVLRAFLYLLKPRHPEATEDTVREIVDMSGLLQVRAWADKVIGLDEDARKNSPGEGGQ